MTKAFVSDGGGLRVVGVLRVRRALRVRRSFGSPESPERPPDDGVVADEEEWSGRNGEDEMGRCDVVCSDVPVIDSDRERRARFG